MSLSDADMTLVLLMCVNMQAYYDVIHIKAEVKTQHPDLIMFQPERTPVAMQHCLAQ